MHIRWAQGCLMALIVKHTNVHVFTQKEETDHIAKETGNLRWTGLRGQRPNTTQA